jgi:hypothetical protein
MSPKSVFIFGFPHSGTTILRTLVGRCDGLVEVREETTRPPKEDQRYVFKWPSASEEFCSWVQYHRVFILRNPLYTFTSILRRFPGRTLPAGHSVEDWESTAELFLAKRGTDVMTLLYEELFPSSHKVLRTLIGALGLRFEENSVEGREPEVPAPSPVKEHVSYRYWQVAQPFQCMNGEIDIPEQMAERITRHHVYRELWGNASIGVTFSSTQD